LPDFHRYSTYQNGGKNKSNHRKAYQLAVKLTKWPLRNIPNDREIHQTLLFKGLPKQPEIFVFWYENIPSGNPAQVFSLAGASPFFRVMLEASKRFLFT
jgi:hypothetical protein